MNIIPSYTNKSFESFSITKSYFNNITRKDCSCSSVSAKVTIAAAPMIALLTLLADLIAAMSNCIFGDKHKLVVIESFTFEIDLESNKEPLIPYLIPETHYNSKADRLKSSRISLSVNEKSVMEPSSCARRAQNAKMFQAKMQDSPRI